MRAAAAIFALVAHTALAADTVPPAILATPLETPAPAAPLRVTCEIVDESSVFQPTFYWRAQGAVAYEPLLLRHFDGATYAAEMPVPPGTVKLEWYLEAYDSEGNGPARFGSPQEPQRVDVPYVEPPRGSPVLGTALIAVGGIALVVGGASWLGNDGSALSAGVAAGGVVVGAVGIVLATGSF